MNARVNLTLITRSVHNDLNFVFRHDLKPCVPERAERLAREHVA
jgi:hypothetical protein